MTIELDDEKNFVHSESVTYPVTALIADIGGATGLFLGMSCIGKDLKKIKTVYYNVIC